MTVVCLRRPASCFLPLLIVLTCGCGAVHIENGSYPSDESVSHITGSQTREPESCLETVLKKPPAEPVAADGAPSISAGFGAKNNMAAFKHIIEPSVSLGSTVRARIANGKLQILSGMRPSMVSGKKPVGTKRGPGVKDAQYPLNPSTTRDALESMLSEWGETTIGVDDTLVQHVMYFLKCFVLCEREGSIATLERSRKYLPQIKQVFSKLRIHEDLAFAVPFVESRFTENALSSAGAAGMFQFLAPTARDYGLTVPCGLFGEGAAGVDERYDWTKTCPAAAQYIANHRKMFNSVLLALGAYHHGADTVSKVLAAIAKEGREKTFHSIFTCSQLGPHSREYIPLCLAAAYLHRLTKQNNTGQLPSAKIEFVSIKKPAPLAALSTQYQNLMVNNPDLTIAEELYCYASTGGYLLITELSRAGTKSADSKIQPLKISHAQLQRKQHE